LTIVLFVVFLLTIVLFVVFFLTIVLFVVWFTTSDYSLWYLLTFLPSRGPLVSLFTYMTYCL